MWCGGGVYPRGASRSGCSGAQCWTACKKSSTIAVKTTLHLCQAGMQDSKPHWMLAEAHQQVIHLTLLH